MEDRSGWLSSSLEEKVKLIKIIIDKQPADPPWHYAITFCLQDGKIVPVLYHRGRRVVKEWSIDIHHKEPRDEHGCSG